MMNIYSVFPGPPLGPKGQRCMRMRSISQVMRRTSSLLDVLAVYKVMPSMKVTVGLHAGFLGLSSFAFPALIWCVIMVQIYISRCGFL